MDRSGSFWMMVISASRSSRRALAAALGPAADPPMTMIFLAMSASEWCWCAVNVAAQVFQNPLIGPGPVIMKQFFFLAGCCLTSFYIRGIDTDQCPRPYSMSTEPLVLLFHCGALQSPSHSEATNQPDQEPFHAASLFPGHVHGGRPDRGHRGPERLCAFSERAPQPSPDGGADLHGRGHPAHLLRGVRRGHGHSRKRGPAERGRLGRGRVFV